MPTMKKTIIESIVAGLITLLLLAVVVGIVYIAFKATPNFLVQHALAVTQGVGTALGAFLMGVILRRIKVARRLLKKFCFGKLFHDLEEK